GIAEDELYIIRREVMANSKSLIKINNQMITLNNLKQIMELVLSIQSQSSQGTVLQKASRLNIWTAISGSEKKTYLQNIKVTTMPISPLKSVLRSWNIKTATG